MKFFLGCLLFVAAFSALGHGGEDHGAPPAATPNTPLAPRVAAATADFELVAVAEGAHLRLYLDDFDGNQPIVDAKVEVEGAGAGAGGVAKPAGRGAYLLDLPAPLAPGRHALTITVEAGEIADLLSATLEIPAPDATAQHVHGRDEWTAWTVAVTVAALAAGLVVARRGRQKARG